MRTVGKGWESRDCPFQQRRAPINGLFVISAKAAGGKMRTERLEGGDERPGRFWGPPGCPLLPKVQRRGAKPTEGSRSRQTHAGDAGQKPSAGKGGLLRVRSVAGGPSNPSGTPKPQVL